MFKVKNLVSKNKINIKFIKDESLPIVEARLIFDIRKSDIDLNKMGISFLLKDAFFKETKVYNENEINKIFESLASSFDFKVLTNNIILNFKSLNEEHFLNSSIDLFNHFIESFYISNSLFIRIKSNLLMIYKILKQKPDFLVSKKSLEILYKNTPFAVFAFGNEDTLKNIQKQDLENFVKKYFTINNVKIIVIGNLEENKVLDLSYNLTKSLNKNILDKKVNFSFPIIKSEFYKLNFNSEQDSISIIFQLKRKFNSMEENYLKIANYIFGDGSNMCSRLFNNIREKKGFCYSISSKFDFNLDYGNFCIDLNSGFIYRKDVLKEIENIIQDFLKNGFTDEEFLDAKSFLIEVFPLAFNSISKKIKFMEKIIINNKNLDDIYSYEDNIKNIEKTKVENVFKEVLNFSKITIIAGK